MADKNQDLMKYGEVISKCWEDEAYKKRFIEDPESVMAEAGITVEEGVTYKVIEQPKMVKYIVLPHENAKEGVQAVAKSLLALAEAKNVIIPEGAEARIIQNTDDTRYLILPVSPKTLTKTELSMAAGGDAAAVTVVGPVVQEATVAIVAEGGVMEVGTVSPSTVTAVVGPTVPYLQIVAC